ncbi:MAG: acyl-CoA dehydrogenase family protein [Thermodesulfobacteriota bacterium]
MKTHLYQPEHEMFRKSFRKYLKDNVIPFYDEWEQKGMVPPEAWRMAGKNGFLCPAVPEDLGGPGGDFLYSAVIMEEIGYHGVPGVFWAVHSDIVAPYIEKFASEGKKKEWLPKCVSGEIILAVAMTEPEVGSDLARLSTSARREGDHYVINGAKTFISNGQLSDLVVTAVRTRDSERPHDGISLIAVDVKTKGFTKGRALEKIGLHAQDTSEIFFNDCRVPAENLLGAENMGFKYLMQNLQQERLVISIGAYAAARGALDLTMDYVKKRKAFGKAIARFQNTRFVLAELATKVQLAQSFLEDLIPRHLAGEDVVAEVSMAKYWITEMQFEVADRCLQLFGGYGYMREYPIARHFVDARVQRIYGGTNEIMKELIARKLAL